ncbi:CHAT domain-containing protein [Flammeovirga aprica]|uniref:CHAT domain-containing protein n=1 Tax=Flammeovirga aprica JL-4 TaxID=694437 RepID=A0A7X9XBQ7_9BACT|nr:CHAT domain-containing protein [Flammeovirga aprica]NME70990.1 CHAT domain-containing protein [Flammeovirga aprica JL-4]
MKLDPSISLNQTDYYREKSMSHISKTLQSLLFFLLCFHFQASAQSINNSKALRASLSEMQAERERVMQLRISYVQEQGEDWKSKWVEQVIAEMNGKNFFLRSVDTEEVMNFFGPEENKAVTQLREDYLEEVQDFLFYFKMDKKENFEELKELYKIIEAYHFIQIQKNAMVNPLQKIADKFFYVTPYLECLEKLYTEASPLEKEKYKEFYNDVQAFWTNAKRESLNFQRIREEYLEKESLDYATVMMLVSKMYNTNQYYLTTNLVNKSIAQLEASNDTKNYYYQIFLLNLNSLYMLQGDYEKMLEVQLKQKELGLLNNETALISSYLQLEEYEKTLTLAEEYLATADIKNPFYMGVVNMKVSSLFALKQYEKAYDACLELIAMSEKEGKEVHSGTYYILYEVCMHKNSLSDAEKYIMKAYDQSTKEMEHLKGMTDNSHSALLYIRMYYMKYVGVLMQQGKMDEIDFEKVLKEYAEFEFLIRNIMLTPSKADRKQVIKIAEECGDVIYQLAEKSTLKATKELAYNYTLLSKEIDLSSVIAIRKYAVDSKNKDYKNLFEEWMKVRKQILFHEEGVDIDSLKDISYGLHKELALKTKKEVLSEMEKNNVEWKEVQSALKPNQIAVEYVFYAPDRYAALVLKKEMESPVIIPLCQESDLKQWMEPERPMSEIEGVDFTYNQNGEQIVKLIIDPLRPYLSDVKTIYYSPSGILHGLSLEALKLTSEENAKRLGKEFRLKRVGKTSLLARQTKLSPRKATIFGGMNYDDQAFQNPQENDGERGLKVKEKKSGNNKQEQQQQIVGGTFNYLRGTLKEVDLIREELASSSVEVDLYTGNAATEDQFIEYCKAPTDILHIASHAYFSPYIKKENIAEGFYKGAEKIYADPDPMNRAGIVFSGANYFWETGKSFENKNDGILMASELSNYDLRKTHLAIVSACQSGIGQSTRSEGVYGFQRAFKLAGIAHQIISLWTVDDAATQKFMTLFYQYYVELSDIDAAVVKAKEKLKEEYEHPYYWAAFVHVQ